MIFVWWYFNPPKTVLWDVTLWYHSIGKDTVTNVLDAMISDLRLSWGTNLNYTPYLHELKTYHSLSGIKKKRQQFSLPLTLLCSLGNSHTYQNILNFNLYFSLKILCVCNHFTFKCGLSTRSQGTNTLPGRVDHRTLYRLPANDSLIPHHHQHTTTVICHLCCVQ